MNIQYRVGIYDGTGPFAAEVLDSDDSGARIRDLATNDIFRVRRSDQLFRTWDEAKSALIDFHLLTIEFAEHRLAGARARLRELVALREPNHDQTAPKTPDA